MRGLEHLHPKAREKAEKLQVLCKEKGLPLLITETLRTTEEQDALYAKGRTTAGNIVTNCKGDTYQSPHQWGVAFDFCKNQKGQEYSDIAFFNAVGALGKSIGLFWGGDFKSFVDRPHFELPEFLPNNSTSAFLKKNYVTPNKFIATWASPVPFSISEEILSVMSALGIMTSTDYWRGVNIQYLDTLLLNAAKKCDKSVNNDVKNIENAIETLTKCGVISSPDYWRKILTEVKYVDTLFINIAKKLIL